MPGLQWHAPLWRSARGLPTASAWIRAQSPCRWDQASRFFSCFCPIVASSILGLHHSSGLRHTYLTLLTYSTCSCICTSTYSCRCSRCRCSHCVLYVPPEPDPRQHRIRGSLSLAQGQYFHRQPGRYLPVALRIGFGVPYALASSPGLPTPRTGTSLISRAPTILTFPSALTGLVDFGPSCLS